MADEMKAPQEASPADNAPPPTTPSPALTNDANGLTPSSSGPSGTPPTPITTTLVDRRLKLVTPSPPPQNCSPFLANLYRTGSIFGTDPYAEPNEPKRSPRKRLRPEGTDSVEQWVMATPAEASTAAQPTEPPPLEPPMSPTAAAPFMPQSQRLKRRRDKTYALRNGDAVSEFSEDSDDATVDSKEVDYNDLDAVSDVEPLGPPVTENEAYYQNRGAIEPYNRSVKVLSTEEITRLCGQPQDLADVLYDEIERLIWAARGRPKMLNKIRKLISDSIVVVEMTRKVSHRICFLERLLEEQLPELVDEEANSAMMENLDFRLRSLETLTQRGNGEGSSSSSQQNGESSRQSGESSRQNEQPESIVEQPQHNHEQFVVEEEEEYDDESEEEEDDETLDPQVRAWKAEMAREKIRKGKTPIRPL